MKNKIEFLLVNLMEECAEVQKAASKSIRFGVDNLNPVTDNKNIDEVNTEFHHILAVVELLREHRVMGFINNDIIKNKKARLTRYMETRKWEQ